jgi:hypothetical protein
MEKLFAPQGNAAAQGCEQLLAEQSVVRCQPTVLSMPSVTKWTVELGRGHPAGM